MDIPVSIAPEHAHATWFGFDPLTREMDWTFGLPTTVTTTAYTGHPDGWQEDATEPNMLSCESCMTEWEVGAFPACTCGEPTDEQKDDIARAVDGWARGF